MMIRFFLCVILIMHLMSCAQLIEPDLSELDQDHDGFLDAIDAFPQDASESQDTDDDGIGDNADTDDDGDGCLDTADTFPEDPLKCLDTDSDDDGILDTQDQCPADSSGSIDTDGDGVCDPSDPDDDNDSCLDAQDAAPLNVNVCVDTDGDGIDNSQDDFPNDVSEHTDVDGDGFGTNTDCNDQDANIYSTHLEICDNQQDDNCDSLIDEFGCVVEIAAGIFNMGVDADGDGEGVLASAQHQVSLSLYYLDKYEVSNAEYEACFAAAGCTEPSSLNPTFGDVEYDDFPIVYVSWSQAQTYCDWAGKRLPTEAEWEYAARNGSRGQGSETIYPWGNGVPSSTLANYFDGDLLGILQNVDEYADGANDQEILNLSGNAAEWVADFAGDYPVTAVIDPTGPSANQTTNRIFRGGSFTSTSVRLEGKDRFSADPATRNIALGFRCASSFEEQN